LEETLDPTLLDKTNNPILFVLAANWSDFRESPKWNFMESKGFRVYTCNEHVSNHPQHIELNFQTAHSFRKSKPFATILQNSPLLTRKIVCLDYAWLEVGYYTHRYGLHWFDIKCLDLLEMGIHEIYLPRNPELEKSLIHETRSPQLHIQIIPDEENPLFKGLQEYFVSKSERERQHQNRYTQPGSRFYKMERSFRV